MSKPALIQSVPTNIITGFLGVGKTTAITHLLRQKPAEERWAVLVNEFGEIGVDGSLLEGQRSGDQNIFIREVPGGCMCCAAGLPMHIALNQLLAKAKPHRLLIEPTGLGHPKEVLQVLSADHYKNVLKIEKTLTLVDARNLSDTRYTNHPTFNQQIELADTVVGNKADLYEAHHWETLKHYVESVNSTSPTIVKSEHGNIEFHHLQGPTFPRTLKSPCASKLANIGDDNWTPPPAKSRAINQGEGFHSQGWRFSPTDLFDRQKLMNFLSGLNVERMKAAFITEEGIFGYNLADNTLTEIELDDCSESRIEIIAHALDEQWESQLTDCLN